MGHDGPVLVDAGGLMFLLGFWPTMLGPTLSLCLSLSLSPCVVVGPLPGVDHLPHVRQKRCDTLSPSPNILSGDNNT